MLVVLVSVGAMVSTSFAIESQPAAFFQGDVIGASGVVCVVVPGVW